MADEEIRLRAELSGALERDLEGAARAADELGDEAAQTAIQLQIMDAAAAGASRSTRDYAREADRAAGATGRQQRAQIRNTQSVKEQTSAYDRMSRILARIKGYKFDIGAVMKAYKIPLIVTAVTALAGAVSALGAAGFAGVAGLAPLTALLTGLPALLFMAGSGFAAVKLGTKGLGDAVSALASGDMEKAQEALAKLTPQARAFATELNELVQGPLKGMQQAVASNLFPGLRSGLADAVPLIPVLRRGLVGSAEAMSGLAASAGRAMGSPAFTGQLGRIMATNNIALVEGGYAAGAFGRALLNLVDGFRPVTVEMMGAARAAGEYLQAVTGAGLETGALSGFFMRAWQLGKDVTSVLTDLSVGLFNVGRESQVMGDYLGGGLASGAEGFRKWTESLAGQASIRQWFADALPVMREAIGLAGDIAQMFGALATRQDIAPLLSQIRTSLLPAISDLSLAVSTSFGPALIDAVTAFVRFQDALTYSPLAMMLQALASTVNVLLDLFELLPGPLKAVAAAFIAFSFALKLSMFAGSKVVRTFAPMGQIINGLRAPLGASTDGMGRLQAASSRLGDQFRTIGTSMAAARGEFAATPPVLSRTQRAAANASGAFRGMGLVGARAMSGIRGAASGLMGFLGGPWGAALIAAGAIVTIFMSKHQAAKQRVEELTSTLQEQTGAITANTRAMVVKQLEDSGALQSARELGLNLQDVTNATMGQADAYNRIRTELTGYHGDAGKAMAGQVHLSLTMKGSTRNAMDLAQAIGQGKRALDEAKTSVDRKNEALGHYNPRIREAAGGTNAAARAEDALARGAARSSGELRDQAAETNGLKQATLELQNAFIKAQRGQIGYEQAVDDASKAIRENRRTMNMQTQAGRDNRLALMGVAEAAAGVTNQAKRQEALEQARNKIARWADAAGMGSQQAQRYADRLIRLAEKARGLPEKASTAVEVTGIDWAMEKLTILARQVDNMAVRRTMYMDVRINRIGGGGPPLKEGGFTPGGLRHLVGEVGPELYLKAKGAAEVIGRHGPEHRVLPEPGVVLPNRLLEAMREAAEARVPAGKLATAAATREAPAPAPAPAPARHDGGGDGGVHVHFHGDRVPSAAEAHAAGRAAAAAYHREMEARRIRWRDGS